MRRQVERNMVRYTGIELGSGVQVSGTSIVFNASINLDELDDRTTFYDICLVDDFQGFVMNTKVSGQINLSCSDLVLPSERISVSLLNSQKEKAFNVTARNLKLCINGAACYTVPDLASWPNTHTISLTSELSNESAAQKDYYYLVNNKFTKLDLSIKSPSPSAKTDQLLAGPLAAMEEFMLYARCNILYLDTKQ